MASIVELKSDERPPDRERHALVIASPIPPVECVPVVGHGSGATFFAKDCERDIALVVRRALTWADERAVANVYVRRETLTLSVRSLPAARDAEQHALSEQLVAAV